MKRLLSVLLLLTLFVVFCKNLQSQVFTKVNADSLIININKYRNTNVEVEGIVIHVCGVDGKKMKLSTENGSIIKILPKDSLTSFDKSFFKKKVKVQGLVNELRIGKSYIDRLEKDKVLLCHIDHTPCKDSVWVRELKESGSANALSKKDTDKLMQIMEQTGKEYISVIIIVAEKVEIIAEK